LAAANNFYSKGIVQFQTATAGKFALVEENIFTAGGVVPGTINADEIARIAINLRSPQGISDLRGLVGPENMNQAARNFMQTAADNATREITGSGGRVLKVIDPDKFAKELGLIGGGKGGRNREGIAEFLSGSGFTIDILDDFVRVMREIVEVADPSKFLKRRVTIGGAGALMAALGAGAAVTGGPGEAGGAVTVTAVALTILARRGSTIFGKPKNLALLTKALDKMNSATVRRAAVGRLAFLTTGITLQLDDKQARLGMEVPLAEAAE
jgi:hypothetical protein